jgi:hypothetical protein
MGVPTAVWMASRHISRTNLPKPLLKAAHKVFSSESKTAISDYGSEVAQAPWDGETEAHIQLQAVHYLRGAK